MSRLPALARDRLVVLGAYALAIMAGLIVVLADPGMSPVWVAALADLTGTALIFEVSRRLDNSSMYDPYWSVAPVAIAGFWWIAGDAPGITRPAVVVALVLVWSVRLTMNWTRRWKGLEDEDWRYVMLRMKHGRRYWAVSFFGIHLLPTVLVFLGCLPLVAVLVEPSRSWSILDVAALVLTAGAIWIEARADAELRRFRESGPLPGSVLDTGLWSVARHPNYLGEVLFWWGLFGFGFAANPSYWWTVVGAVSITLLFKFVSVPMMDERMLERQPAYAERMALMPALLPRVRR